MKIAIKVGVQEKEDHNKQLKAFATGSEQQHFNEHNRNG